MADAVLLRAVAFGVSVSATALAVRRCGRLSDIGPRDVPLQPPDWVFGVVWPCLYATTGIAWATSGSDADVLLGCVTLLCCAWLVVYACLRETRAAAVVLLGTVVVSAMAAVHLRRAGGGWWLAPLVLWTAFATYLNAYDALRG